MLGGQIKYRLSGDKLPLTGRLFSVLKIGALLCLTQNQHCTTQRLGFRTNWTPDMEPDIFNISHGINQFVAFQRSRENFVLTTKMQTLKIM